MENKDLDEFQIKHLEKLKELENCKKDKAVNSCRKCDKFFDCELRIAYVDAVFYSMNKGKTGGFDF